jgi:hypothetical protein
MTNNGSILLMLSVFNRSLWRSIITKKQIFLVWLHFWEHFCYGISTFRGQTAINQPTELSWNPFKFIFLQQFFRSPAHDLPWQHYKLSNWHDHRCTCDRPKHICHSFFSGLVNWIQLMKIMFWWKCLVITFFFLQLVNQFYFVAAWFWLYH